MVTTHRVVRGTSLTLEFEALNFTPKDTGTFVLHVSKIPNDSSGPYVFTIVKPYSELTDDDIDGNIVTVNLAPDSTNLATGKYLVHLLTKSRLI